jgi:hypothetical protein
MLHMFADFPRLFYFVNSGNIKERLKSSRLYAMTMILWRLLQIVWTVQKSNRKIVEKGKIYTPNTHIHDRSFTLSFIHIITITIKIQQNLSTLNFLWLWYCGAYSQNSEIYINISQLCKTNIANSHNVYKLLLNWLYCINVPLINFIIPMHILIR